MKKLSRKSLDELAKIVQVIDEEEQRMYIGGGNGSASDPYTENEFDDLCNRGKWSGGYVEGWGYVFSEVTINGYGGGHVIGTQGVESMKFETGLLDIGLSFISGSFLITAEQARFNDNINNVLSAMSSQGISSVYYVKRYLGGMSSPSAGGFLESYQHLFIDGATGNTIATFGTTW